MHPDEQLPGELARKAGQYMERNVLGSPTGTVHHAKEGEPLPLAPRGFTWRYMPPDDC